MLTKDQIMEGLASLTDDERREVFEFLSQEQQAETSLSEEWKQEIARRLAEYRRGEVKSIPADVAHAEAEARLAAIRAKAHAG